MDTQTRMNALAHLLDESPDNMEEGHQTGEIEIGKRSYLVLTDSEADTAAANYIAESVWAFNVDFLRAHSKALRAMHDRSLEAFEQVRARACEDANAMCRALIDDFDHFVEDAIKADGREHFLAGYDGREQEVSYNGQTFYVYRVN